MGKKEREANAGRGKKRGRGPGAAEKGSSQPLNPGEEGAGNELKEKGEKAIREEKGCTSIPKKGRGCQRDGKKGLAKDRGNGSLQKKGGGEGGNAVRREKRLKVLFKAWTRAERKQAPQNALKKEQMPFERGGAKIKRRRWHERGHTFRGKESLA